LDLGVLERNLERLVSVPVDGIYTTDSDGEFYAIEIDTFRELAQSFAKGMSQTSLPAAMGVTWSHTEGIVERMRIALDCGITAFHVAFPFWMPLAPSDMPRFWEDLARAVPNARWIHYNTPRGHRVLSGKDYSRLHQDYPEQFVGTKLGTGNVLELVECLSQAPEVSHFTVEYTTVPGMMWGAKGVCSYWVNTLPKWTRKMMDHCLSGEWEEAMGMQKRLLVWEARHTAFLRQAGFLHGILGKTRGALSGFLEDSGQTRPPYYPIPEELKDRYRKAFNEYWKGEN
jgi:dihydrodipicolinate synthase/N-acetylneuraminate lyase